MLQDAFREVLDAAGLPDPGDRVTIGGVEPVVRTRFKVATAGAACEAAVGTAISELWKLQGGKDQRISVDLAAAGLALRQSAYFRIGGKSLADLAPNDPWFWFAPVKDGRWIRLHTQFPHHFEVARRILGGVDSFEDAKKETLKWDGLELEQTLHEANGCAGFVRTLEEWAQHPQALAVREQPLLEIRRIGDGPIEPLRSRERPLGGIRLLDLTRVLAGPSCAKIIASHGADVLKVNGEHLPNLGWGELDTGIGKLSTFIDLRTSGGAETLRRLLRDADVFLQGYRPGTLARRGFSPEEAAEMRPGIVYTELSAWGTTGPWRLRKGYDTVVQAVNGMAHTQGDETSPGQLPVSAIDYVTGHLLALGTIVALTRRAKEGGSWHVRASLARIGEWIKDRGMFDGAEIAALPKEPPAEIVAPHLAEMDAPDGRIRYFKPILELSQTPPYFARPPVPLGSSPAEWPANAVRAAT